MPGKLEGRVAVVTGASKGIGASIAKYLAETGAAVVVNYASSKPGADKVVAAIAEKGGKVEDIAPAVVFLASDDASYITGETLHITGGFR